MAAKAAGTIIFAFRLPIFDLHDRIHEQVIGIWDNLSPRPLPRGEGVRLRFFSDQSFINFHPLSPIPHRQAGDFRLPTSDFRILHFAFRFSLFDFRLPILLFAFRLPISTLTPD